MTIKHHPDNATLMSFASGSLGEALSAVVAAHLDMCPRCAAETRRMERIGAAMFEALSPSPISRPTPSASTLEALTRERPARAADRDGARAARRDDDADADVPRPLRKLVGPELDRVPWRRIGIGVWHYPLPLSPGATGDLRLLKVAPGQAMPDHGHGGAELTLMLRGSYRDEIGTFRTGDLADLDDDVEHRPVADLDDGCICLIASVEKARFRGLLARLFQPLTGF